MPAAALLCHSLKPAALYIVKTDFKPLVRVMQEAKLIGEDYLQLEKYANLNYMVSRCCFI
jgi:hypothetical protein